MLAANKFVVKHKLMRQIFGRFILNYV